MNHLEGAYIEMNNFKKITISLERVLTWNEQNSRSAKLYSIFEMILIVLNSNETHLLYTMCFYDTVIWM